MSDLTKSFDGQLVVSAPVSDKELSQVAAGRGVFALLAEGDRPIILLSAAGIRARLKARLSEPLADRRRKVVDLRKITRKVLWKLTGSHFETDLAYFNIARKIWPKTYADMLAWKAAWFVGVDPADRYPHFVKSREVSVSAGRYVGPFPDGRSAGHFIDALRDAFKLCRDYSCLRQFPNAQRCAYAEMGKCLSVCDGSISMDQYRRAVAEAADFAAGRREGLKESLTAKMSAAAEGLQFEKAAGFRQRLERLTEFDKQAYQFVAPLKDFRYLLIQRSGSFRRAKAFLACVGQVAGPRVLDYPPKMAQIRGLLDRMAAMVKRPISLRSGGLYRMGLVGNYLFCGRDKAGLIVRWHPGLKADALARQMVLSASVLKLRVGKRRQSSARAKSSNKSASKV